MRANLAVTLGSGLLIWACAKANDSDLISRGIQPVGGSSGVGGAASGRAGNSAASGTSSGASSAGKGGTGGGAFGGANAAGGSRAQGGSSNSGGASSGDAGESSASGGTIGAGGQDGIPPEVLERADVVLRYQAMTTTPNSSDVNMRLYLENKTSDTLELEHVTIRYWMSSEPTERTLNCYYAAAVPNFSSNVHLVYMDAGDDSHIEVTFGAGAIPGPTRDFNSTEIQVKSDTQGSARFDQENDYSFDAGHTSNNPPEPHDKITVYLAGKLIWGCEPSGSCAGEGEGGAGGEAGHAGEAGQAGTSGAGGSAAQGGEGGQGATGAEGGQGADGGQPSSGGQSGAAGA